MRYAVLIVGFLAVGLATVVATGVYRPGSTSNGPPGSRSIEAIPRDEARSDAGRLVLGGRAGDLAVGLAVAPRPPDQVWLSATILDPDGRLADRATRCNSPHRPARPLRGDPVGPAAIGLRRRWRSPAAVSVTIKRPRGPCDGIVRHPVRVGAGGEHSSSTLRDVSVASERRIRRAPRFRRWRSARHPLDDGSSEQSLVRDQERPGRNRDREPTVGSRAGRRMDRVASDPHQGSRASLGNAGNQRLADRQGNDPRPTGLGRVVPVRRRNSRSGSRSGSTTRRFGP